MANTAQVTAVFVDEWVANTSALPTYAYATLVASEVWGSTTASSPSYARATLVAVEVWSATFHYSVSVSEAASAVDTVFTGTHVSLSEAASAADSVNASVGLIIREDAHATDTVVAGKVFFIHEAAAASDSLSETDRHSGNLNESANAVDRVSAIATSLGTIVEPATAQDHVSAPTAGATSIHETATAVDHSNGFLGWEVPVHEAATAADHPAIFHYIASGAMREQANAADNVIAATHTNVSLSEWASADDGGGGALTPRTAPPPSQPPAPPLPGQPPTITPTPAIRAITSSSSGGGGAGGSGSAGGGSLDIYSAWVAPSANTWDASYARFDEQIVSFTLEHEEGQIPKLTMQVKNPRAGLLASPNYWFWLSYSFNGGAAQPLFFGRLIGIPTSILANVIEIQLIARPTNYIYQKQKVAETLKVLPNYDPIFLDVSKRDDPDAILEGWSVLYHVDRITNVVSVSDILIGEDGVVSFCPPDVPYDSVQMKLLQSPLVAVNVKAQVAWEQRFRGFFNVGSWAYPTLGGDAFVGDWPKTGAALGGGYSASISWAGERDPGIEAAMLAVMPGGAPSIHYEWHNTARHHEYGDTMSITYDYQSGIGNNLVVVWAESIPGILNPFTVDAGGNPDPTNQPLHEEAHYVTWQTYALDFLGKQSLATLGITYEPNRKRTEQLELTLQADVQPILIDPLVTEDTEQVVLKSGDLSMPLIDLLNWDSVAGLPVAVGVMVFPDNPVVPGQTSTQIAVVDGTAGLIEPTFSNIAGVTTVDGTVTWSSLGVTQPVEQTQDWVRAANVSLGAMVLPKPISGLPDIGSLLAPGQLNYPPTGVAVTTFEMYTTGLDVPGATITEVTQAGFIGGLTGATAPLIPPGGIIIIPTPTPVVSLPSSQAVTQTFVNPSGMFLYVCVQAGQTGLFHTSFNETYGSLTTDGTVVWQNVGQVSLAIGGWPGMTPARSYFPSDRGQQSLQHMMMRARAKLRKRARAVTVAFETRFQLAAQLSCRMSAGIADTRLPGGQAYGKVIGYKLILDGDSGRAYGAVTLGCSIGNYTGAGAAARDIVQPLASGGVIQPGTPEYVEDGYVARGYQVYDGAVVAVPAQPASGQGAPVPGSVPPGGNSTGVIPPNPVDPTTQLAVCPSPPPMQESPDALGYTPPVEFGNDDGLVFPANPNDLILISAWHGIASTLDPNNIAAYNELVNTTVGQAVSSAQSTRSGPVSAIGGSASETVTAPQTDWGAIANAVEQAVIKSLDQGHGLWYELVMKPLTNGPFGSAYVVTTTLLPIPQTIDLSAPSSGG